MIELTDFIENVKGELIKAHERAGPDRFLALYEIEMEVSFVLSVSGGAKGKLFVVDLETSGEKTTTHKVTLKFKLNPNTPYTRPNSDRGPDDHNEGGGHMPLNIKP